MRRVPDARFVIVGEGELEAALRKQIKDLHLEKHVLLAGFRPDALSLQKGFDLFAMSSVTEGMGSVLLDAMAKAGVRKLVCVTGFGAGDSRASTASSARSRSAGER